MKQKYRVTTGVFKYHEFYGYELNGRIIDDATIGRSYPIDNCEELEECFSCKKPMDATEHNYGTEDMLCCIHCYQLAQEQE